jgi:hypothetical protein
MPYPNTTASVIVIPQTSGSAVNGEYYFTERHISGSNLFILTDSNGILTGSSTIQSANITNLRVTGALTASNISASGFVSASVFVGAHTGSTFGTSSWSNNALTASIVLGSITSASFATSASFSTTASFALNTSLTTGATYLITSSWTTNALTASSLIPTNNYQITNLTASNISASGFVTASSFFATGNITINGGSINTTATNFNLATSATTLTIGGSNTTSSFSGIIDSSNTTPATITGNGAIQTDGGVYIGKNLIVSGSTTLYGDLTIFGTGSIVNISSSNIIIGDNRIQLNAWSLGGPQRYGGIDIFDSGSSAAVTSSILWDSLNNYWLLQTNQTGSPVVSSSAIILQGPTSSFGNEYLLTVDNFLKVQTPTGNMITSSLSEVGNTLKYTGTISASVISGSHFGTSSWAFNSLTASSLVIENNYQITNLTTSNISASGFISASNIWAATGSFTHLSSSGPIFISGSNAYIQLLPVGDINIPTNTTASYIYCSGSTNDLYFTQFNGPFTNTTRLRWLEANMYTGILYGGQLSSTFGSTTFNVKSGSGLIVAMNATTGSDPYPTIKQVAWPDYTNIPITNSGSAKITYVGIDNTGQIVQQTNAWGSTDINQWDDEINLGVVLHLSGSVSTGVFNSPQISYGYPQKTDDFTRAFGPLKISGHTLQASGSGLSIQKTGGVSFREGANYYNNPNHPSTVTENAITASKIYRYHLSGSTPIIDTGVANAGYTTLDNKKYVNLTTGQLVTIGGSGNNHFTIQRIFWVPNSPTNAFIAYYGNGVYSTLLEAENAIDTESFTESPNTALNAIFVAYVIMEASATNLTTIGKSYIQQGGLFRSVGGVGSSGTSPVPVTLASLTDVAIAGPTQGDLLIYGNGTQWNNSKTLVGDYSLTGSLFSTGTISASVISGSHFGTSSWANNSLTASSLVITNSYQINNLTASNIGASGTGSFGIVGIGTTAPVQKLSIAAGGNLSFQNTLGATGNYGAIYSYNDLVNTTTPATAIRFIRDISNIGPDGAIAFDTNNTERIRVTSANGYVGIGTTTPNNKLHVYNSAGSSTTASNAIAVFEQNSNAVIQVCVPDANASGLFFSRSGSAFYSGIERSGTDLFLKNNNTAVVTINSSGNVGIGTTNPAAGLDVSKAASYMGINGNDTYLYLRGHNTGRTTIITNTGFSSNYNGLAIITNETNANSLPSWRMDIGGHDGVSYGIDNFWIGRTPSSGSLSRFFLIDNSGNVGIGTTSPAYKLDVNGNSNFTNGFYTNTDASSTSYFIGANGTRPVIFQNNTATSYDFGFKFTDSNTFTIVGGNTLANPTTDLVSFTYDGNVGIGTTAPAYKLDVSGTGRVGDTFLITTATTADARLEIGSGRSGNGNSYLDLVGDATYTDYGLRLIRYDTGANAISRLEHKGTGQLQLFLSETGSLTISTNSSERMRITSGGNVGIGTTNPTAKLEVVGGINSSTANNFNITSGPYNAIFYNYSTSSTDYNAIRIYQGATGSAVGYLGTGGSTTANPSFRNTFVVGTQNSNDFVLNTTDTERMRIAANGNVGIGTSIPTGSLHIENTTSTIPILSLGGGEAGLDSSDLYVLNSFNTSSGVGYAAKVIGINISGSLTAENIPLQRTVWSGVNSATAIVLSADDPGAGTDDNAFQIWTSNQGTSGSALTQKFSLTSDGNVGIGTTAPVQKLEVSGNVKLTTGGYIYGDTTTPYLRLNQTNGTYLAYSTTSVLALLGSVTTLSAGSSYLGLITNGSERFRIDNSGNVGIGTTNPVNRLDVVGNISCSVITASLFSGSFSGSTFGTSSWATNSLTASYLVPTNNYQITNLTASSISASGTIRATNLIETSTIAAKYNIFPLENQLDKIIQLNPVSFNYKLNDQPSIGLIAEEVGKIYPEFTSETNDAISYGKMVSVLIQSVKELKIIVENQQQQINKLLNK